MTTTHEPLRIVRMLDTAPCVPIGEPYVRRPATGAGLALGPIVVRPGHADAELYRMHTMPDHYFPEQIHTCDDARVMLLDRVFPSDNPATVECVDWDCHACKHTVATVVPTSGPVRCPVCYTKQP